MCHLLNLPYFIWNVYVVCFGNFSFHFPYQFLIRRRNLKRSLTSPVRPTVHTNLFSQAIFLVKRKSKMTSDCCVFKFLWRSVDGKLLMGFQSETSAFKFLRRIVWTTPKISRLNFFFHHFMQTNLFD